MTCTTRVERIVRAGVTIVAAAAAFSLPSAARGQSPSHGPGGNRRPRPRR